jgi:VWFA-related protein
VFEDNVEQEIAYFTNESQPFTVALVLDMSYSTTFKIGEIQTAAIAFIDQLRPDDRVMVISFDQDVHMLCEATSDRGTIYRAIRSTRVSTGTSLYEAVDLTMNDRLRAVKGRKAVVLFTDGVDTTSTRSNDLQNVRDALELDALIYTIRYDTFADVQSMKNKTIVDLPTSKPTTPPAIPTSNPFPTSIPQGPVVRTASDKGTTREEYQFAEEYLNKLANLTGGSIYLATTFGNLNSAFGKIASELREFYSLGYYPTSEEVPGKTRRIKVKVDQTNVAVRARDSYVIPKKKKLKTS